MFPMISSTSFSQVSVYLLKVSLNRYAPILLQIYSFLILPRRVIPITDIKNRSSAACNLLLSLDASFKSYKLILTVTVLWNLIWVSSLETILNVVSKLFEFLIHDHVSHYLFKFALPPFSALTFWKLYVVYFLLALCSVSALRVKVSLLLYALQLLIFFVGTLTYLETKGLF